MLLRCCWRGLSPALPGTTFVVHSSRVFSCQLSNNINKKVNAPRRGCTYGPEVYADCHEDCRNLRLNINKLFETCNRIDFPIKGIWKVSKHLKNIFESGELQESSVVSKMETTASDGKNYNTNIYNLDAIIAVGYRINSKKATMFRIWAISSCFKGGRKVKCFCC